MSGTTVTEHRQPLPPAPATGQARPSRLRDAAATFWLNRLFWIAARAPKLTRGLRGFCVWGTFCCSHAIRDSTKANARRIFGPQITEKECADFGRRVLGNFYDFVCDVGRSAHSTPEQINAQIDGIIGDEHFIAARALKKGAIIATAHMGSFEAGAAALREREKHLHVVFKRDATRFEQVRSSLRKTLGVIEAPVDDGWGTWIGLREALLRDEVVMVQADRTMPGQKGCKVPFLHGHLLLPTGPIKLAIASGAPIIPVFVLRSKSGKIQIHVEPAILVESSDALPHPALLQFSKVMEKYVGSHADQWLCFQKAFCEDAPE